MGLNNDTSERGRASESEAEQSGTMPPVAKTSAFVRRSFSLMCSPPFYVAYVKESQGRSCVSPTDMSFFYLRLFIIPLCNTIQLWSPLDFSHFFFPPTSFSFFQLPQKINVQNECLKYPWMDVFPFHCGRDTVYTSSSKSFLFILPHTFSISLLFSLLFSHLFFKNLQNLSHFAPTMNC